MKWLYALTVTLALLGALAGCSDSFQPLQADQISDPEVAGLEAKPLPSSGSAAPAELVTVGIGQNTLEFWPYTGTDFSGTPQDPINLIFCGKADPRDIRTALLALDGDRTAAGFPPVPPFNATWNDCIGDVQTAYGSDEGWVGSVVQLECGNYDPVRFHIRLFRLGPWTVANAHFEAMIPGTTDHQVLSWELAEQLVIVDLMRTGLLDPNLPLVPTDQINPAPYKTIPAIIYNGLPEELKLVIGGPGGNVANDVPIISDGHAVIFNLASKLPRKPGTWVQDFVLNYNQVVPKPFCNSGSDYLYVTGPVHLKQTTRVKTDGAYDFIFEASGELNAVPVNPMTGEPIGTPLSARVYETHAGYLNNVCFWATSLKYQKLGILAKPGGGVLLSRLRVSADHRNGFEETIRCSQEQ